MPDDANEPSGPTPPPDRPSRPLDRIPLIARMIFYAVFFLAVLLGALPWLFSRLDRFLPPVSLPWPVRIVGWAFFAVCLVLYLYCSYVLTRRGRGAYVEFDPPQQFVSTGPYRWVRNPVAATAAGMVLGEAVGWSSPGVFLFFLIGLGLAHVQVVRLEEPLLAQRFGQSYLDYKARVPRWIPRRPRETAP